MLGDLEPRPGHHKSRSGRDVKRAGGVAAGAAGVHHGLPVHVDFVPVQVDEPVTDGDAGGLGPHHPGRGGDLGHGLALHPQRGDEGADLGLGGLPIHNGLHGPDHLGLGQVLPADYLEYGFFKHALYPSFTGFIRA